jgi:O-acetyl-ADP-ribose deacetylase (regulator of RNase III)
MSQAEWAGDYAACMSTDRRIRLVRGDITVQEVEVIVNAANSSLLGGGGVDGAIHRAGGPSILAECRMLGGCSTGEVRVTGAGELPARYVIHAVGPVWSGGAEGEPELLASCYRSAIEQAAARGCRSIAFPAISCGVYGYPVDLAAVTALEAVRAGLAEHPQVEEARFVLFDDAAFTAFSDALRAQGEEL